jgi:hypothetical protein
MKYLLPLLFGTTCAILLLAQPRHGEATVAAPPSAALLDAMSSHGIEVSAAADAAADAAPADAGAPALQPALDLAGQAPLLQPAVYRRGGR